MRPSPISNSRGHHEKAVQVGSNLLLSPSVKLVHIDQTRFRDGWEYFRNQEDKDYSLTDCISFIVIQQLALETAFTFDIHFVQAGFKKQP